MIENRTIDNAAVIHLQAQDQYNNTRTPNIGSPDFVVTFTPFLTPNSYPSMGISGNEYLVTYQSTKALAHTLSVSKIACSLLQYG